MSLSMYTGLAQPEVKTNGLSFTSSSILAVVSAMNALSAKCMGGANFNRLESAYPRAPGRLMRWLGN